MASYQWFLLGMMVAWTPSVVMLAILLPRLRETPTENSGEDESKLSTDFPR
jgi:hypothetical protein